jgi:DNA-binding CsgD family transcriptional regulator
MVVQQAMEVWRDLLDGHWCIVRQGDQDGERRLLLAKVPAERRLALALSAPERRVASLAQRGRSSKQIAYELAVSPAYVSRHLGAALRKLGLRNASELARSAGIDAAGETDVLPPPGLALVADDGERTTLAFPLLRPSLLDGLSPAERAVVTLLVSGHSVSEVAQARQRSRNTVDNQIRTIYGKLGIGSRQELVRAATSG